MCGVADSTTEGVGRAEEDDCLGSLLTPNGEKSETAVPAPESRSEGSSEKTQGI